MTPERLEAMTFSEPYLENAQVVVVLADSPYQTLADFAGKTCGVQEGSSAQEAIRNTPDFASSLSQVVPYKENLTALMDLEVGGVDAVAMDFIVANYMIKTSGKNFRILDEHLSPEEYGIGFKKGNTELRDAVQKTLSEMKADGTLGAISEKWFGSDITVVK